MSVASISGPQLLDLALRTTQHTVDEKTVGIGGDLGCDPGRKPYYGSRQCLPEPKDSLEARQGDLYLLPYSGTLLCRLAHQRDSHLDQLLSQPPAVVGEIPEQLAPHRVFKPRLAEELPDQGDIRDVGGCKLVGDGDAVG